MDKMKKGWIIMDKMKKKLVGGYIRVSTERQVEGYSIGDKLHK